MRVPTRVTPGTLYLWAIAAVLAAILAYCESGESGRERPAADRPVNVDIVSDSPAVVPTASPD